MTFFFCGPIIPFTHTHTHTHAHTLTNSSLAQFSVCLSVMKLNSFLCCKAFPCVKSSVLFSEFLSECPPKMHKRSHYSYPYLHTSDIEKWNLTAFRLLSLYRSQVSGSLSSHVKPCRLAQALESQGSGLLLPWEQVPKRCCQLFPASSFAVGV